MTCVSTIYRTETMWHISVSSVFFLCTLCVSRICFCLSNALHMSISVGFIKHSSDTLKEGQIDDNNDADDNLSARSVLNGDFALERITTNRCVPFCLAATRREIKIYSVHIWTFWKGWNTVYECVCTDATLPLRLLRQVVYYLVDVNKWVLLLPFKCNIFRIKSGLNARLVCCFEYIPTRERTGLLVCSNI